MAYTPTTWEARIGTGLNNFTASGAVTGDVTLTPNPTAITQEGTAFTAARMNNLEQGVSANDTAITALNTSTRLVCQYSGLTSGISISWFVAYKVGKVVSIYLKFSTSTSVGSGNNAMVCTLTNMSGWLPPYDAEGFGYYSSCGFGLRIESDGSVTVRNASASSRTLSDGIQFHVTYVIA